MKHISNSSIEKIVQVIFITFFLVVISTPIIQMYVPIAKELESTEKRPLAIRPELVYPITLSSLGVFVKGYEQYVTDHFGFRNVFIKINNIITVKVFKKSPTPDVILGQSGWLFYNSATDGTSMSDFEGKALFSKEDLVWIKRGFSRIKDEVSATGAEFIVMIPPNKQTVYPEFLPKNFVKGETTRLDQVKSILKDLHITFVDSREALLAQKSKSPVFYKTDTHWNNVGAFIGYKGLMEALRKKFPFIFYYKESDMYQGVEQDMQGGDLAYFLSIKRFVSEINYVIHPKTEPTYVITKISEKVQGVSQSGLPYHLKALIYHDSFFDALQPLVFSSFSEAVYVKSWYPEASLIHEVQPDVVIWEYVERYNNQLLGWSPKNR